MKRVGWESDEESGVGVGSRERGGSGVKRVGSRERGGSGVKRAGWEWGEVCRVGVGQEWGEKSRMGVGRSLQGGSGARVG